MAIRRRTAAAYVSVGGPAGLPGQSAYGAWLALGNAGSAADFIASLKGSSGASTISALTDATPAFAALNTDAAGQRQAMGAAAALDLLQVARATLTALGGKVDRSRTAVDDAAYTALASDIYVALTALTAARTITLPAASAFPVGQPLYIADESGACSATRLITVVASGSDTIAGQASIAMGSAFLKFTFHSNGSNLWTVA